MPQIKQSIARYTHFPNAQIIGCTTSGEISDTAIYDDSLYLTAVELQNPKVEVHSVNINSDPSAACKDLAIVRSIIDMGKNLDLTVIAEGVETQEHRRILIEAGCHVAQGYLYSKPTEAVKISTDCSFKQ